MAKLTDEELAMMFDGVLHLIDADHVSQAAINAMNAKLEKISYPYRVAVDQESGTLGLTYPER